jgi:UDP-N-acetylglucosamine 2-epimerase
MCVVEARPTFVKAAPVLHAVTAGEHVDIRLLDTGQHHDHVRSGTFIEHLEPWVCRV